MHAFIRRMLALAVSSATLGACGSSATKPDDNVPDDGSVDATPRNIDATTDRDAAGGGRADAAEATDAPLVAPADAGHSVDAGDALGEGSAGSPGRNLLVPEAGAWFGAYPGGGNAVPTTYEGPTLANRPLDLVVRYQQWDSLWPSAADEALVGGTTGRTALACRWAGTLHAGGDAQWADIASGTYDSVINAAAARWAAWGAPMIVSPFGEFDGDASQNAYASALVATFGNDSSEVAAAFVACWKHIWNIVAPIAPNVVWDWNPTGNNMNGFVSSLYPGDGFVDWIGADLYDSTFSKGSPTNTYTNWVNWVRAGHLAGGAGTTKPMGLFETGIDSVGSGGTVSEADEAAWLNEVPACMAALDIKAWCYWNDSTAAIPPSTPSSMALANIGTNAVFTQK